jgi:hypothetical protein
VPDLIVFNVGLWFWSVNTTLWPSMPALYSALLQAVEDRAAGVWWEGAWWMGRRR